jgi:type I restriction enzyme S subunit
MNELPLNWTSTAVANAFEMNLGKMLNPIATMGDDPKPYLANRNVQWNRFELDDLGSMGFSASERNNFRLIPGDLLICEGGEVGRTAIWSGEIQECYFQKAIHRLRPKGNHPVDSRYMLHYMAHIAGGSLLHDLISQTSIAHLTQEKLAQLRIYHPIPLGEQQRIAEIIDSVEDQINVSQRLVSKYQEARVAAVRSALTVGLDRFNGREAYELRLAMPRDAHSWPLAPLGNVLLGVDAGNSPDLEDTPARPGEWGVLKVSAVGTDGFRPEENKIVQDRSLCIPSICVREGDLLITRANTPQLVGRSCIVGSTPPSLMLCDKTLRLRVNERSVPTRYINIALGLAEVRRQIEIAATGTSGSMKNISQQSIKQLMIPLGSQADIQRVVEIDRLHEGQIATLSAEVDHLRLLKLGLMDDLISGQVQVSNSSGSL